MTYSHTQTGLWHWVSVVMAAMLGVGAIVLRGNPTAGPTLAVAAVVLGLCSFCFRSLTVEDGGDALELRFGPLTLFRTRFAYDEITAVERDRTTWLDGWGIRWAPGRGWLYNLWGHDCVRFSYEGRPMRIGTDDPDGLVEFLRARINERESAASH